VDTIIAETNAGSVRWKDGLEHMPIPLVTIQDGGTNLDQFVLPDEGISVAETETIEQAEQVSSKVKFTESTGGSLTVLLCYKFGFRGNRIKHKHNDHYTEKRQFLKRVNP
jgi:hypothetical protein